MYMADKYKQIDERLKNNKGSAFHHTITPGRIIRSGKSSAT